jgi:hypothetical protein
MGLRPVGRLRDPAPRRGGPGRHQGDRSNAAQPAGAVLLRFRGASQVTIHRPTRTAASPRTAVEQGDLRRPVLKAVGGEASWKTSVSTRKPTVRHRLLARRPRRRGQHPGAPGCQGAPAAAGHGAVHRHRRVHRTSPRRPATGGGRSCSTTMTRAAHRLVERQGGRLIKSTGDGILAVCDTLGSNGIIDREEAGHGRKAGGTGAPGLR